MNFLVIGHSVVDKIIDKDSISIKPRGIFYTVVSYLSQMQSTDKLYLCTSIDKKNEILFAPAYGGPTVHGLGASRAVGGVAGLLDRSARERLDAENREAQARLRAQHERRQEQRLLSYADARANRLTITWHQDDLPVPPFVGRREVTELSVETLVPYIDWTFFFHAWELKGRVPQIFEHPQFGAAARDLYDHAQALLETIVRERRLTLSGVYGFWPAASDGDDVVLFADAAQAQEVARFNMLRQQAVIADGKPNRSLADFVAPKDRGLQDSIGAFAVTAGHGLEALVRRFESDHDDYHAIMAKALADRLAEAFAEWLHERVRREWGYGAEERLSPSELAEERYRGIRPAFGYPACPDHSEKFKLFDLLGARRVGIDLTETAAMLPAASVSGLYFAHPSARYFMVGRIGEDQVRDYARRKGVSQAEAEQWLGSNLAYVAWDSNGEGVSRGEGAQRMRTWIVTDGAGFIGCNFVRYALGFGDVRVVVFDKLTYAGSLENLRDVLDDARVTFVHADIADRPAVDRVLAVPPQSPSPRSRPDLPV